MVAGRGGRRLTAGHNSHTFVLSMASADAVGALAAEILVNRLTARPICVLLPTGHTPLPFYAALRREASRGRMPATGATVLQLDGNCGLAHGDLRGYTAYLERELQGSGLTLADGATPRAVERGRTEIDLAVLGIGQDGQVAFNEPGSLEEVPSHVMTAGLRTLLEARELLVLVTGSVKAEVLHAMLTGRPSADVPASLLRLHPRLTVLCDDDAAARLPVRAGSCSDRAVIVLGHRDPNSRKHRASVQSFGRLAVAARLAERTPVRAVVLTGFTSTGGLSEAEQMAEEWSVPSVPALLEVAGRNTIENATCSLPLALAIGGIKHVTVVTSAWHLRARRAFRSYHEAGLKVSMRYDWAHGPWLRMLRNEIRLMRSGRSR